MGLKIVVSIIIFSVCSVSSLQADHHVEIPSTLEAKLVLTALTYDKNLDRGAGDELVMGVFYLNTCAISRQQAERFFQGLYAYRDKLVRGLTMTVFLYGYETVSEFKQQAIRSNATCVYITTTQKTLLADISDFTRDAGILTVTGNVDYVKHNGLSMAVGEKDKRPRIYLNLTAAAAEGADFDARFLRVADIVRGR